MIQKINKKKKRKKGVRNANSYKWVRIKKARLEGASYVNSVGNEVPARQYGGDCR